MNTILYTAADLTLASEQWSLLPEIAHKQMILIYPLYLYIYFYVTPLHKTYQLKRFISILPHALLLSSACSSGLHFVSSVTLWWCVCLTTTVNSDHPKNNYSAKQLLGNLVNSRSIASFHFTKYGPTCKSCWYNIKVFSENIGHPWTHENCNY